MRPAPLFTLLLLLAACGDGPLRHYLIAVDASPLQSLPDTCYAAPASRRIERRNLLETLRWTLFEGANDRAYLELTSPAGGWPLGDAPVFDLSGTVAGHSDTFEAERAELDGAGNTLTSRSVRVRFLDADSLPWGTLEIGSSCSPCEDGQARSCSATLSFSGREDAPAD